MLRPRGRPSAQRSAHSWSDITTPDRRTRRTDKAALAMAGILCLQVCRRPPLRVRISTRSRGEQLWRPKNTENGMREDEALCTLFFFLFFCLLRCAATSSGSTLNCPRSPFSFAAAPRKRLRLRCKIACVSLRPLRLRRGFSSSRPAHGARKSARLPLFSVGFALPRQASKRTKRQQPCTLSRFGGGGEMGVRAFLSYKVDRYVPNSVSLSAISILRCSPAPAIKSPSSACP